MNTKANTVFRKCVYPTAQEVNQETEAWWHRRNDWCEGNSKWIHLVSILFQVPTVSV